MALKSGSECEGKAEKVQSPFFRRLSSSKKVQSPAFRRLSSNEQPSKEGTLNFFCETDVLFLFLIFYRRGTGLINTFGRSKRRLVWMFVNDQRRVPLSYCG